MLFMESLHLKWMQVGVDRRFFNGIFKREKHG